MRLGIPATRIILRVFMVAVAAYAVLVLHRWIGVALLAALLVPLDPSRADRYWNHIRLIMGLGWLAILGWVYWTGAADGLLGAIDRSAVIPSLGWIR